MTTTEVTVIGLHLEALWIVLVEIIKNAKDNTMAKRKLIFNIYDDLRYGRSKPITSAHLAHVISEIPFKGAILWTLADGSKLMAAKHSYVKNETYDIYWTE